MKRLALAALLSLLSPNLLAAQENPFSGYEKMMHRGMKVLLIASAERMPDESYDFRPAELVRTYGQILGHIADSYYMFCSTALGAPNPAPKVEQTQATKPQLIAALKEAFAYCDAAFDEINDAAGAELVTFRGAPLAKLNVLGAMHVHTSLHYGNLITYMRIKNIVPPTSDPAIMPQPKK